MNKQQRIRVVFVCSFILFTLSVPVLNMAPVTNDPPHSQQDLMYSLSQENQTEFSKYQTIDTRTESKFCFPRVLIDVVDLDGVASVWFSYKRSNESQWNNKSMNPSNQGANFFIGYLNVIVSERTTVYNITFYANDSLGHISESELYELSISYSPSTYGGEFRLSDLNIPIIVGTITMILFSVIVILDKRTSKKTIINE
ncbi:MAG: hypothetical protein ACTSV2_14110 [Candidatus Thorarchaeota archaeon]